MTDEILESNIVIKTSIAKPNRQGFKDLHSDVDLLNKKLTDLTSKAWTIRLQIDDTALKAYGLAKKVSTGNTTSSAGVPVIPVAQPSGQTGIINPLYRTGRRVSIGQSGSRETIRSQQTQGGNLVKESLTTNEEGEVVRYVRDETDLFLKAIQDRLKANADFLKKERKEQERINASRTRLDRREASDYLKEQASIANTGIRRSNREANDYRRQVFNDLATSDLRGQVSKALASGYVESAPTRQYNSRTGQFNEIRNLTRTTGNAFTGYTVEILKANEATKRMTIETLTGSRAMRFLGDSVQNAVSKVLLWSAATSAVFVGAAAIKQAAVATAELEENTVLLARVGNNFAGGSNDFSERYSAAKKLTDQLVALTTIYGGNAVAAQEAAAIFARSGRDEKETLEATRVALISTRIAELDVVEAAKLLSAAMLQFKLNASQLLPTLDVLNSLSNRYRVTTNDLLQAISRTGAVYAEHNGRLSELAATTAVVSQVTSRSGAEIGNALKTITSNLDRLDTQDALFEKLGVSTVNFSGETESLGKILFQLRNRFDSLADSEERQLTLQIAGIRQRNILVTAIQNADEALIAENKALLDSGSATKEFYESSHTLIAALQRLLATLTQVANQSGSVLLPIAKDFLYIVESGLRLFTIFNGLPTKVVVAAGSIVLLHKALTLALASIKGYIGLNVAASASAQTNAAAVTQQAAALGLLQAAYTRTIAASRAFVASGGLLTAALVLGISLLGNAAELSNSYAGAVDAANVAVQQSIDAEENRRRALHNTTEAVADLILRYEELSRAGKKAEADQIKNRGVSIASSAGINLSNGNFSLDQLIKQDVELQRQSAQRERSLLEKQRGVIADKILSATENRQNVIKTNRLVENPGLFGGFAQDQDTVNRIRRYSFGSEETRQNVIREHRLTEAEANEKVVAAYREQAALEEKIKNTKERAFEIDKNRETLVKQSSNLVRDRLRSEEIILNEKLRKSQDELDPAGSFGRLTSAYQEIERFSNDALQATKELLDLYDKGVVSQQLAAKKVEETNKLLEKRRELSQEILRIQQQAAQRLAESGFNARENLLERGGAFTLEAQRRLSDQSPYSDELARIDQRFQQQLERLQIARRVARNSQGNTPQEAGTLRAAQVEQQTALVNLKTLEQDRTLAILEAEKNIAIERKKSADEAARAVGSLSQEDRLRVRALASYFAANPNKKLSVDEQFLLGQKSSQLIQQFFPGRLESLSDARSPFAKSLQAAGIGLSEDLINGAADVRRARGNRTDADLLNQTLARIEELERKISASNGVNLTGKAFNPLGIGAGGGVNATGQIDTRIPIDLHSNLNLDPLIESFEHVATELMNEKVQEMSSEVRRILKEEQALNKRVQPKVATRND